MSVLKRYNGTNWEEISMGFGEELPIGTILPFADDTIPSGYLLCDGSAVSRETYSILFSIIGTTYGSGDGSTTFNLPNLKGKVPIGLDSSDSDFDTLGETGGDKTQDLRALIGAVNGNIKSIGYQPAGVVPSQSYSMAITGSTVSVSNVSHSVKVVKSDGKASSTIQPYTVVNYIIKATQTAVLPISSQVVDNYSTSATDSYSANYINSNYIKETATVLYENSTGSNTTVTLNDDPTNYDYLEVDFKTNDGTYHRIKSPNPYGALELFVVRTSGTGTSNVYIKSSVWAITGNVLNSINHNEVVLKNGSSPSISGNNYTTIVKVIGYK